MRQIVFKDQLETAARVGMLVFLELSNLKEIECHLRTISKSTI